MNTESVSVLDLKRGDTVMLRNGWEAEVRGTTRQDTTLCLVHGWAEELGSVYTTDILRVVVSKDGGRNEWVPVAHTPGQLKRAEQRKAAGY